MALPSEMIQNASLRGQEFAWSLSDFVKVLHLAKENCIACSGGQFQFRLPDGPTCEMYWNNIDIEGRKKSESWPDYVKRSCTEAEIYFIELVKTIDWGKEAKQWNIIRERRAIPEFNPIESLCFVAYFEENE